MHCWGDKIRLKVKLLAVEAIGLSSKLEEVEEEKWSSLLLLSIMMAGLAEFICLDLPQGVQSCCS